MNQGSPCTKLYGLSSHTDKWQFKKAANCGGPTLNEEICGVLRQARSTYQLVEAKPG